MNSNKIASIRKMLSDEVPDNIRIKFLARVQKEVTQASLDMQNLVKEQVFDKSKRAPYECIGELGTGRFWCLDCGDKFCLKSSYDFHINRCSIKITHYCQICKKKNIFTNKCMMLAHVREHTSSTLSFNLLGIVVEPPPAELLPLGHVDLEYDYAAITNMTVEELQMASCKLASIKKNSHFFRDIQSNQSNSCSILMNPSNSAECLQTDNRLVYHQSCHVCTENFTSFTVDALKLFKTHHYRRQQYFSEKISCLYCKLEMPNKCAQVAHNNVHVSEPPYICPECGATLSDLKSLWSHLSNVCFHFSRALDADCRIMNCLSTHQINILPQHFITCHTKQLFKCDKCTLNFNTVFGLKTHSLRLHQAERIVNFKTDAVYRCQVCNDKVMPLLEAKDHMREHESDIKVKLVYRCEGCKCAIQDFDAFKLHVSKCTKYQNSNKSTSYSFHRDLFLLSYNHPEEAIGSRQNNIRKENHPDHKFLPMTCHACGKSLVYLYDSSKCNEGKLPIKCPLCGSTDEFKSSAKVFNEKNSVNKGREADEYDDDDMNINENDDTIYIKNFCRVKDGFANRHKRNKRKTTRAKRKHSEDLTADRPSSIPFAVSQVHNPGEHICAICDFKSLDKNIFHDHIITHKNVSTAYQCMECGLSFTVRPSFATHLLTAHGISNIDEYLQKNNCVDVQAIANLGSDMSAHPANENQCSICYEQFQNKIEHDKHFRIHGMAFLANTKQMTTQKSPI